MASIHISEQISNGNFDGNKVIQLWNLTFLVQCIFLNVGISLLCCVIHSPPLTPAARPVYEVLHITYSMSSSST